MVDLSTARIERLETDPLVKRITDALEIAHADGSIDGAHHKAWVIDQMVRALTGCPMVTKTAKDAHGKSYSYETRGESDEYEAFLVDVRRGKDGPNT